MSRQELIILSAEREENRPEKNKQLTENLRGCLDDCKLNYDNATGLFNGQEESSFVVRPKDEIEIHAVKSLAFKSFDQDSVLHVDKNNLAWLVHKDGLGKTYQGIFTELESKEKLLTDENYTIIDGKAFATRFLKVK